MKSYKALLLLLILTFLLSPLSSVSKASAAANPSTQSIDLVIPSTIVLDIGEHVSLINYVYLSGFIQFKSSKSSIVSVDEFGIITGKKAGEAVITASCLSNKIKFNITVRKTEIKLKYNQITLEPTNTYQLLIKTSCPAKVTFKSRKKSIVSVDEHGFITANKLGKTEIIVTANGTKVTCKVSVIAPTLSLNRTKLSLYKNQSFSLSATVSNGEIPVFTSSSSRIATVSKNGVITAKKHGTAVITAKVNGTSMACTLTVLQPIITLSHSDLNLMVGETCTLTAKVSSGNQPTYQSSNSRVVKVTKDGELIAKKPGVAYITVSEDGTKAKCKVTVTNATVTS